MNSIELRKNRRRLNLTQEELGKLIGVSKRTIINYEKGEIIPETKSAILHSIFEEKTDDVSFLKKQIVSLQEDNKKLIELTSNKIEELQKIVNHYENLFDIDKRLRTVEESIELMKMVQKVDSEIDKIKDKKIKQKSS